MTDQTHMGLERERSNVTSEYRIYFGIIFVLALPFVTFTWLRDLLRGQFGDLRSGIIRRALNEAHVTTPKIFSAW